MPVPPPPLATEISRGRGLKRRVGSLLGEADFQALLDQIGRLPPRRVINPLFSFLYHGDPMIRWRAVSAMGHVVSRQAENDMPAARIIMRRLMWNLNDESGGIGWGSPEAMGDIMARSAPLTREYHRILISYVDPSGNFLEHEGLQRGALWGVGRLFHARPETGTGYGHLLIPFFKATDPVLRGLAAWAAIPIASPALREPLKTLTGDIATLQIYEGTSLNRSRVDELARRALRHLEG